MDKTQSEDGRVAILVLGMHRSGTSATARFINLLGASLPANLLPPAEGNELGFWEPRDLLALNDRILDAAGSRWDDWRDVDLAVVPESARREFQRLALELLQTYFSGGSLLVLKEPRLCRLLAFWLPVLDIVAATPKCLIPLRNPIDVALSLRRQHGFTVQKGMLLWLRYVLDVERATRKLDRAFFSFGELLDDWRSLEQTLRHRLGGWPKPTEEGAHQIDKFLDPKHRHYAAGDEAVRDPTVPELVGEAFAALAELRSDPDSAGAMRKMDDVGVRFDLSCRTFGNLLSEYEADVTRRIDELQDHLTAMDNKLAQEKARAHELEEQLLDWRGRTDGFAGDLHDQRRLVQDYRVLAGKLAARLSRIETGPAWKLAWPLRWSEARLPRATHALIHAGRLTAWTLKLRLPRELKRRAQARMLINEGMFDEYWYIKHNPDVALRGYAPVYHWLESGWKADRDPNARFDMAWYREAYMDPEQRDINPVFHYLEQGRQRGYHTRPNTYRKEPKLEPGPILAEIATFERVPLISVLMPTYNTNSRYLRAAVDSVRSQLYSHWELIVCDDGSTSTDTLSLLTELEEEAKLIVLRNEKNQGISAASNRALAAAKGDFIVLLDHDDVMTADALFHVARRINEKPTVDAIYSDQDKLDPTGRLVTPFFKPDWSPTYLLGVMYVGHLLAVRRELALSVGGFNSRFDKVQDYEFMLRLGERASLIEHVPRILYHWRAIPGSVAHGLDDKAAIDELQAAAVNEHLRRSGIAAIAVPHDRVPHRVTLQPRLEAHPLVSIIIPTKDAPEYISRCLDSLYEKTSYPNFEVVLVDNGTVDLDALEAMKRCPARIVPFDEQFNYSRANNLGVKHARGEIIVLLNNDTEVISPDWLDHLVLHLSMAGVGAVGPMLIYPGGRVQHAGIVLGFRGTADHVMRKLRADSDGYAGSLVCSREVSAVTGACLCMRRADYKEFGGMSEDYACHYQDVDLCLRLRERGQRILYVPNAQLYHYESVSRGDDYDLLDRAILRDRWGEWIAGGDPYYNPNFVLHEPGYEVRAED